MNYYFEYIWIDAFQSLRSKTKVIRSSIYDKYYYNENHLSELPNELPEWNFDGSSTGQAEGFKSDIILKPKRAFVDPFNICGFLILCETYNPDGTPHSTNARAACEIIEKTVSSENPLFGLEQEYIIYDNLTNLPLGWKGKDIPSLLYDKQGPYYCSVGGDKSYGRDIATEHLKYCCVAELDICGINAEVTPSQWEFQIGPISALNVSDQLWIARYILNRITEKFNCRIEYHPKPMENWNGSGCHTNFSTEKMRKNIDEIYKACERLGKKHDEHLKVYGNPETNKLRLTGSHETASFDKFSYGVSDRGASIRIPLNVANDGFGYLEDRRPPSDMDPYVVTYRILKTVCLDE